MENICSYCKGTGTRKNAFWVWYEMRYPTGAVTPLDAFEQYVGRRVYESEIPSEYEECNACKGRGGFKSYAEKLFYEASGGESVITFDEFLEIYEKIKEH